MAKPGKALAKPATNALSAYKGGVDPFTAFGNEAPKFGAFMKFSGNTGDFSYGAENEPLELGTQLVVNMMEMARGWVCWINGKPFETITNMIMENKPAVQEEELPDYHEKYVSAEDDGWVEQTAVPMALLDDGSELDFKTSSASGQRALQKLAKDFGSKCQLNLDDNGELKMPVVEIGNTSFEVKKKGVGIKWAPTFKIVDWISVEEMTSMQDAAEAADAESDPEEDLVEYDPETGEVVEDDTPPFDPDEAAAENEVADGEDATVIEDEAEVEVQDEEDDEEAAALAALAAIKAKKAAKAKSAAAAANKKVTKTPLEDGGKAGKRSPKY